MQSLLLLESVDEPGVYVHDPDPDDAVSGMVYNVDVDSGLFSDGSGDDKQYAIFRADCFLGNDFLFLVEAWSHDENGDLLQLPNLLSYSKWDGQIEHVEIFDGKIRVHTLEPAPGEETPHLDGYAVEVVTDWSYGDEGWVDDEISRVDTTPEPEPQPEPAPEPEPTRVPAGCETPNASAQDAALCLVAAANANDYELAATVASPSAVEFVRETRGWGPIEWEFNGYSETCWFYEPSNDPQFHGVDIEMTIGTRDGDIIVEWVDAYG